MVYFLSERFWWKLLSVLKECNSVLLRIILHVEFTCAGGSPPEVNEVAVRVPKRWWPRTLTQGDFVSDSRRKFLGTWAALHACTHACAHGLLHTYSIVSQIVSSYSYLFPPFLHSATDPGAFSASAERGRRVRQSHATRPRWLR